MPSFEQLRAGRPHAVTVPSSAFHEWKTRIEPARGGWRATHYDELDPWETVERPSWGELLDALRADEAMALDWSRAVEQPVSMHPAFVSAEKSRRALERLKAEGPHPFRAPARRGRHEVLVHKSTRKPGWWQATFFEDGEPIGDSESATWEKLLEHIRLDDVDWEKAKAQRSRNKRKPAARFREQNLSSFGKGWGR